jgi:hypothetical protein
MNSSDLSLLVRRIKILLEELSVRNYERSIEERRIDSTFDLVTTIENDISAIDSLIHAIDVTLEIIPEDNDSG